MEHDAYSSRRYEENWSDAVEASKVDAEEIAELKEAYALLFKENALLRQGQSDYRRECGDTDAILRVLGLDPFRCRTEVGSLQLLMISGAIEHRDAMLKHAESERFAQKIARLCASLGLAVRQNEHDMLMTGEELRSCRNALDA